MDAKRLAKLRLRLSSRLPLLGNWLRRRAARELAEADSPQAMSALAEAVDNTDAVTCQTARARLKRLDDQACIDAVCAVWAEARQATLADVISEQRWIASAPPPVRVLSALQVGDFAAINAMGKQAAVPLVAACEDADARLAQQAQQAVAALTNRKTRQAVADQVCGQWAKTRSVTLEQLVIRERLVARQPLEARLLAALKIEQPELVEEEGAAVVAPLLGAINDADAVVAAQAHQLLRRLKNAEAKDEVCRCFIEENHDAARAAALESNYLPRNERQRAVFFFLTDQWERYEAFDFEYTLLRSVYEVADAALRQRITEKLRAAGRTDFLAVIVGSDFRARAASITEDETRFLIQMFERNREWAKLWTLLFELPVVWGARIVGILAACGWKPEKTDEQETLAELMEIAADELLLSGDAVSRHLPPAVRRAQARVKGRVNDLRFSPVAQVIAIGTGNRKVALWNYQHGNIEKTYGGFAHSIGRVVFLPDGSLLCAERTTAGDTCALHALRDGARSKLAQCAGSITALEAVGAGQVFYSGRDSRVALLDTKLDTKLDTLSGRPLTEKVLEEWVRAARVANDGSCVALVGKGVELLRLPDFSPLAQNRWGWEGTARAAAFAPDDEALLIGKFNGEVLVCRHNKPSLRAEPQPLVTHTGQVQGIEVLAERRIVVTAGADRVVHFTSWENRAAVGSLQVNCERLTALRVSPDGAFMALGDSDAAMSLWDLRVLDVPLMFARPLARAVPVDLAAVEATIADQEIAPQMRRSLRFLASLLRHRFRYDIEIDEVPVIQAGEFDIEIEG